MPSVICSFACGIVIKVILHMQICEHVQAACVDICIDVCGVACSWLITYALPVIPEAGHLKCS